MMGFLDKVKKAFGPKKDEVLFAAIYSQEGCVSERMIKDILEVPILSCQNIILLFLFMDVFGIYMMAVSMQGCLNLMWSFGRTNFMETGNVMNVIRKNWKKWGGMSSQCGSAN